MRKIGLLFVLGMGAYVLATTPRPLLNRVSTDFGNWIALQEAHVAHFVLSHPTWRQELRHVAQFQGSIERQVTSWIAEQSHATASRP